MLPAKLNSKFVYFNAIILWLVLAYGVGYLQTIYAVNLSEFEFLRFVIPGVVGLVLALLTARIFVLSHQLKSIATHDPLTQAFNQTYYNMKLNNWCEDKVGFSLILIDADYFKSINFTYGHKIGDEVLVHFCKLMNETKRLYDVFARHDGEKFVLLVPRCDLESASKFATRLCKQIERTLMPSDIRLTCSFGVAEFRADSDTPETLFERADSALLESKNNGRNRVTSERPEAGRGQAFKTLTKSSLANGLG